jgi:hypothetical protein
MTKQDTMMKMTMTMTTKVDDNDANANYNDTMELIFMIAISQGAKAQKCAYFKL